MKTETTRQQKSFLVAILLASLMMGFQNCSSSIYTLSVGKPSQAKTDFNQMLTDSESEIDATKQQLKKNSQFEAERAIAASEERTQAALTGSEVKMTTGTQVPLQFVRKVTKKAPVRSGASVKSKNLKPRK